MLKQNKPYSCKILFWCSFLMLITHQNNIGRNLNYKLTIVVSFFNDEYCSISLEVYC